MGKKPDVAQSNVSSDVWAEALATYILDKAAEDRARGNTKKHQLMFESQGVDPAELRRRYKESRLSEEDRIELYATEQRSRRALDLWSATNPEDFQRLIEQAAQTRPATGVSAGRVEDAIAYSDGNNSARIGGVSVNDNPHIPGTSTHQQWALGWADGTDEAVRVASVEISPEPEAPASAPAPKRKQAARKQAAPPTEVPPESLFGDMTEMPEVPGLPN